MGRLTTSDFVVETVGHCFICMEEIWEQLPSAIVQPGSSSSIYSLLYLSRYLKIKMRKVFNEDVPIPEYLLGKVEMSTLKVSLCEECAIWNAKLSELLRKLEKIEMEAASYLRLFHGKLKRVDQEGKPDIFSIFADRCSASELMGKLEVAEALRKETMERCSQKMNGAQLKVRIQKLSENDIEIMKQPKPKCNLETSSRVDSERGLSDVKLETSNVEGMWDGNDYLDDFEEQNKDSAPIFDSILKHDLGYSSPEIRNTSSKLHHKSRRNSRTGRYECQLCVKTFVTQGAVNRHYQSFHLKIGFKCNICDKHYTQRCHLNVHKRSVHLKERFNCPLCSMSFATSNNRRRHIRLQRCERRKSNSDPVKQQDHSQSNHQDQIDTVKIEVKTQAVNPFKE